jgi:nucleoside-diphosphate-sugar epimerase
MGEIGVRERKDAPMARIFLAGASGVLGQRLVVLLAEAGHQVGGMTRSAGKVPLLHQLGAEPVVCDAFDRVALILAVGDFMPDIVLSQLTDLPDDVTQIGAYGKLNARMRTEGNQNLIAAARASGSPKILVQSVAWQLPEPEATAVKELERATLDEGGVVLSYGQWYGPGTYNERRQPAEPRVHVDRAAGLTIAALNEPSGIITIVD